ncbi:hypothetical protein QCD85_06205 [Paenibacillus sp. PsM32]|uniref:hypothetical protein n=1 Tax=Paenibacillus sp. PsM32 TaxID=3030536 RepID=UPI00263A5E89|nr:hypothetical protein [Paenibacillus sp. PsM32]MDN4617683.1 hypothetical protein [Paenibacillus sp. PsM32]
MDGTMAWLHSLLMWEVIGTAASFLSSAPCLHDLIAQKVKNTHKSSCLLLLLLL